MDFCFKHLDRWLLYGQVCKFDVQAVEVDSLDAFTSNVRKFLLADSVEAILIWNGTCLVEVSKEIVEVNDCSRVDHKLVPEGGSGHWSVCTFVLSYYLLEVPRERQHVGVLVLVEQQVRTHDALVLFDRSLASWLGGGSHA